MSSDARVLTLSEECSFDKLTSPMQDADNSRKRTTSEARKDSMLAHKEWHAKHISSDNSSFP